MSFEYSTRVAVLAGALTLGTALGLQGRQADPPAYLNPDLAADARAADLVSRMTLEEKVSQMTNDAPAIPRLGIPAYDWWNESSARRRPRRRRDRLSAGDRPRRHLDSDLMHESRRRHLDRSAREVSRAIAAARHRGAISGPDVLVAQHQHLSRSALGTRPGNLRRRSVPDRPPGRRVRQGTAGRRSEILQSRSRPPKHYAVHSGPEADRHRFDVHPSAARSLRDVPARLSRARAGRPRRVGHVRVQPRRRRARLRQQAPAASTSCAATGASTATSSPTAAPSTTSTGITRSSRRARPRRRWA